MTGSRETQSIGIARAGDAPALRVLLVDDHAMFRRGLRELLETHGVEVIGEASDGRAGVRLACELTPDVVVMDLSMPVMSGLEATRALMSARPATRILVVTVSADEADVVEALLGGACGYVLKDAAIDQLLAAIHAAHDGDSFISPSVAGRLVKRLRAEREVRPPAGKVDPQLTKRELEVLGLLALGRENHEIASAMHVSDATVKRHVSAIYEKLHVNNRIQAAVYAVRHELDEPARGEDRGERVA